MKRAAVDAAKAAGISREGLMAHGGWTDTQMPSLVYADQEAEAARREGAEVRAKIRGENIEQAPEVPRTYPKTKNPPPQGTRVPEVLQNERLTGPGRS